MIDFVMPKKNEKALLARAMDLGYSGICFCYDDKRKNEVNNAVKLKEHGNFEVYTALIDSNKRPQNFDFFITTKVTQSIIKQKPLFVFYIEGDFDFIHQRDSGMNHVLCKMMKKYKVGYVISLESLKKAKDMVGIMGRVKQNVMLCNKYGTSISIFSFADKPHKLRNPKDIQAFARVLGVRNLTFIK